MRALVILGFLLGCALVLTVLVRLIGWAVESFQERIDASRDPERRPRISIPDAKAGEEEVNERYWSAD